MPNSSSDGQIWARYRRSMSEVVWEITKAVIGAVVVGASPLIKKIADRLDPVRRWRKELAEAQTVTGTLDDCWERGAWLGYAQHLSRLLRQKSLPGYSDSLITYRRLIYALLVSLMALPVLAVVSLLLTWDGNSGAANAVFWTFAVMGLVLLVPARYLDKQDRGNKWFTASYKWPDPPNEPKKQSFLQRLKASTRSRKESTGNGSS